MVCLQTKYLLLVDFFSSDINYVLPEHTAEVHNIILQQETAGSL
jgi:hypothetical protein